MKKNVEAIKTSLIEKFEQQKKESEKVKIKTSQIYLESPALEPEIPPDIKKRLESVIVLDGSKHVFECLAIGTKPFEIKWFKNGVELGHEDSNYSFGYDDRTGSISLTINQVDSNENALFSCRVTNDLGMAETSAYLKVKGMK